MAYKIFNNTGREFTLSVQKNGASKSFVFPSSAGSDSIFSILDDKDYKILSDKNSTFKILLTQNNGFKEVKIKDSKKLEEKSKSDYEKTKAS
jgi:hypothetical protein